jgi:hypothetical protein
LLRQTPEAGTAPVKQHLVLGHDERQLFVVGVDPVSSIRDALDSLKPGQVRWNERWGAKVIRQGDWFFTPLRGSVEGYQENGIAYTSQPLGGPSASRYGVRVGNPHVAEEQLVFIGDRMRRIGGEWQKMGREIKWIVVRGKIRHSEHATVELPGWHFAVQNTGIINNTIGFLD